MWTTNRCQLASSQSELRVQLSLSSNLMPTLPVPWMSTTNGFIAISRASDSRVGTLVLAVSATSP